MRQLLICLLCALQLAGCGDRASENSNAIVSLHAELGGDASGYQRACSPTVFDFPRDHLAHPQFRNEWWYVTGNVESSESVRFGFHATLFRIATQPAVAVRSDSAWETEQFYMAHFAVTREGEAKVLSAERFARSAVNLAGTSLQNNLAKVWLEDWVIEQTSAGESETWRLQLSAQDGMAVNLTLVADKPRVLQGKDGYSQKSSDPCNASYYYSYTRLRAQGELVYGNEQHQVTGSAWFDREWSSSALAQNQVGWDWFALQLDDGREIMFYQLREADGTPSPFSYAVEVNRQGVAKTLVLPSLTINRWWQSDSGARYPVEGELILAGTGEVIHFAPLIDNQELNLTVRYWEGAIRLRDVQGAEVGRGYLELTGY